VRVRGRTPPWHVPSVAEPGAGAHGQSTAQGSRRLASTRRRVQRRRVVGTRRALFSGGSPSSPGRRRAHPSRSMRHASTGRARTQSPAPSRWCPPSDTPGALPGIGRWVVHAMGAGGFIMRGTHRSQTPFSPWRALGPAHLILPALQAPGQPCDGPRHLNIGRRVPPPPPERPIPASLTGRARSLGLAPHRGCERCSSREGPRFPEAPQRHQQLPCEGNHADRRLRLRPWPTRACYHRARALSG
jgi:hypothetical protein